MLVVAFSFVLVFIGRLVLKDWTNPVSLMWSVVGIWVGIHDFGLINYEPVSWETSLYIISINIGTTIGVLFGCISKGFEPKQGIFFFEKKIVIVLAIITFPFLLILPESQNLMQLFSGEGILRNESFGDEGMRLDLIVLYPMMVIVPVSFYVYIKKSNFIYLIPFVFLIVNALVFGSRALLLMYLIMAASTYVIVRKNDAIKGVVICALVLIACFVLIGNLRDSNIETNLNYFAKHDAGKNLLTSQHYITGSYSAFDDYMNKRVDLYSSNISNVAPVVSKFIQLFELDTKVNYYKYELSDTEPSTNVYSAYKEIYEDFGWVGGFIMCTICGLLVGKVYKSTLVNDSIGMVISLSFVYAFMIYSVFYSALVFSPLLLSVFASFLFKANNRIN